jgi:hypothetical protein
MNCSKCNTKINDDFFVESGTDKVFCYDCADKKAHRGSDRKKKNVVFFEKTKGDRWVFCASCHKLMQINKKHHICNFCYLDMKKRGVEE